MEKDGRLPAPSRQKGGERFNGISLPTDRYKEWLEAEYPESTPSVPPAYPESSPGEAPEYTGGSIGIGIGIGFGNGIGIGKGKGKRKGFGSETALAPSSTSSDQEDEMANIVKEIQTIFLEAFNRRIVIRRNSMEDKGLKELVEIYDKQTVVDTFRKWTTLVGSPPAYPISSFLEHADEVLQGVFAAEDTENVDDILRMVTKVASTNVVFQSRHMAVLIELKEEFGIELLEQAFRKFYDAAYGDEFQLKHASRLFTDTARSLIRQIQIEKETQRHLAEQMELTAESRRKEIEEHLKKVEEEKNSGFGEEWDEDDSVTTPQEVTA